MTRRRPDRRPSFPIRRAGTDVEVAFAGIPLGHEFTSLVLALLQVGGHPSTVDERLLDRIRGLEGEHHFETYFSLSCQNCPDVVQALNLMSIVNPRITHVAIDGAIFPDEVERRTVLAVPTVFRNGELFAQGRMTLEQIVAKLDERRPTARPRRSSAAEPFDVLVVGGGPAGATAAIYAARKGIRTGVVVERFGGQVLDTMAIENFISVPHTEGPKLAAALEHHVREYDVEVIRGQPGPRGAGGRRRGRARAGDARQRRHPLRPHRRARDRRSLASDGRARGGRVPQQGRHLLPALRRSAVQGQACRGDRRRQLRRRGGHRPRRASSTT